VVDQAGGCRQAAVQHHQCARREHPNGGELPRAVQQRRCLVSASGWYEWQKLDAKKKRPIHMRPAAAPFALAGVYDVWKGGNGHGITSFAIVTTDAAPSVEQYHDRMSVVLSLSRPTVVYPARIECPAFRAGFSGPRRQSAFGAAGGKAVNLLVLLAEMAPTIMCVVLRQDCLPRHDQPFLAVPGMPHAIVVEIGSCRSAIAFLIEANSPRIVAFMFGALIAATQALRIGRLTPIRIGIMRLNALD